MEVIQQEDGKQLVGLRWAKDSNFNGTGTEAAITERIDFIKHVEGEHSQETAIPSIRGIPGPWQLVAASNQIYDTQSFVVGVDPYSLPLRPNIELFANEEAYIQHIRTLNPSFESRYSAFRSSLVEEK